MRQIFGGRVTRLTGVWALCWCWVFISVFLYLATAAGENPSGIASLTTAAPAIATVAFPAARRSGEQVVDHQPGNGKDKVLPGSSIVPGVGQDEHVTQNTSSTLSDGGVEGAITKTRAEDVLQERNSHNHSSDHAAPSEDFGLADTTHTSTQKTAPLEGSTLGKLEKQKASARPPPSFATASVGLGGLLFFGAVIFEFGRRSLRDDERNGREAVVTNELDSAPGLPGISSSTKRWCHEKDEGFFPHTVGPMSTLSSILRSPPRPPLSSPPDSAAVEVDRDETTTLQSERSFDLNRDDTLTADIAIA